MKKKLTVHPVGMQRSAPDSTAFLVRSIRKNREMLKSSKVTAGFDGFVDSIVHIIREKRVNGNSYFTSTRDFGNYIREKSGASFSLEVVEKMVKLGGNMPIMANAMGQLGIPVNCVGALGYPDLHPVFSTLSRNCRLYSFADPGPSTACEFNDGKIMLAQMANLSAIRWKHIRERIGLDALRKLYAKSDLICQLNWSEIDGSSDMWKGLLKDVLAQFPTRRQGYAFFDLSDCSGRSENALQEAIGLIRRFNNHCRVVLSLNRNEAGLIYRLLIGKKVPVAFPDMATALYEAMAIDTVVLHSSRETVAINLSGAVQATPFFTSSPAISTGAGDNFNAGFCAGLLLRLELRQALQVANAVSGYYVRNGKSPGLSQLINFLKKKHLPS